MSFDTALEIEKLRLDLTKKYEDFVKQCQMSANDFQKSFDTAFSAALDKFFYNTKQVIETKANEKTLYRTTISGFESILNEWPENTNENALYWKTHKEQVDNALKARHELLKEIVDTIGNTIGGVFGAGTKTGSGGT
jgi:hypothetical protein